MRKTTENTENKPIKRTKHLVVPDGDYPLYVRAGPISYSTVSATAYLDRIKALLVPSDATPEQKSTP